RIIDLTTETDRARFAEVRRLFQSAFPYEAEAIDRIEKTLADRTRVRFDPVLLVSLDARHRVSGMAYLFYFPDLRYGYLQYIASDARAAGAGHRRRARPCASSCQPARHGGSFSTCRPSIRPSSKSRRD